MANIQNAEQEIVDGLERSKHRLHSSRKNLDYYRGNFDAHRYRIPDSQNDRNHRSSLLMQRIVNSLTSYLYRDNPLREVAKNNELTTLIQRIYKDNSMWAQFQAADRLSMIAEGGAVAFQVAGAENPKSPAKIHLWPGHSFEVWTSDNDPLQVDAVCTIDRQGGRDRWTLWTDEVIKVFLKDPDTKGRKGRGITLVETKDNSYGVLPFSFAHYETPVIEFFSGAPGTVFREINDYIMYRFTELSDAIKHLIYPKYAALGADPSWKPPAPWAPGDIAPIPAHVDENGNRTDPKIEIVTPPLGFVEEVWKDILNYVNHSLECAGVPESAIRMVQSVARSGQSIAQEQAPLVNFARGRQRAWLQYETNLARKVLEVSGAHLRNNGQDAGEYAEMLEEFELSIRWAPYYSAIPGPERDRADAYSVQNGYSSRLQVLQEREGMTRDEAVSRLRQVRKDKKVEDKLVPPQVTQLPPSTDPATDDVANPVEE